jgi:predicted nucleotide-binding protein (sugar kinase/HSP70/actin superfamily)
MQMAQAVVPSYNASTVAQSTSTSDTSTVEEITAYSLKCGADQIIQHIITEKLKQVRLLTYFGCHSQFILSNQFAFE